jgi:hypothetical protein
VNLIEKISPNACKTIAGQILDMLLADNYHSRKNNLCAYFKRLGFTNDEIELSDKFIASWIAMERKIKIVSGNKSTKLIHYSSASFKLLAQRKILSTAEIAMLENLYGKKNDLLHAKRTISPVDLSNDLIILKAIAAKISSG